MKLVARMAVWPVLALCKLLDVFAENAAQELVGKRAAQAGCPPQGTRARNKVGWRNDEAAGGAAAEANREVVAGEHYAGNAAHDHFVQLHDPLNQLSPVSVFTVFADTPGWLMSNNQSDVV